MSKSAKDVETNTEGPGLLWSCFVNWVNTLEKVRDSSQKSAKRTK
jgi:hypothetical protein